MAASQAARKVSIGLPVYNGSDHLRAAMDSLVAQDHRDLEIIISDNASEDATADICREYAARDSRIKYSRNATNIGPNRNFMRVLELATADHFMWASHDDIWAPDYVRRLRDCFDTASDVALAAGHTLYVTETGEPANEPPDRAPPDAAAEVTDVVRSLLDQHATSWFYGLYRRSALIPLLPLLEDVPVWGGDVIFLLHCCLHHAVIGDDRAVLYKRLRIHNSHQPKTPRAWVRWQRIFASAMVREVLQAPRPLKDKVAVASSVIPYVRKLLLRKGPRRTAKLWLRATYQYMQGRDNA